MPSDITNSNLEPDAFDFYLVFCESDVPLALELQRRLQGREIKVCAETEKFQLTSSTPQLIEDLLLRSRRIVFLLTLALLKSPTSDILRLERRLAQGKQSDYLWLGVDKDLTLKFRDWEYAAKDGQFLDPGNINEIVDRLALLSGTIRKTPPKELPKDCNYHFFLSFVGTDRPTALALCRGLEERGYSVFYDAEAIRPGDDVLVSLTRAISKSRVMVFLLSKSSVLRSAVSNQASDTSLTRMVAEHQQSVETHLCEYIWLDIDSRDLQQSKYWNFVAVKQPVRLNDAVYTRLERSLREATEETGLIQEPDPLIQDPAVEVSSVQDEKRTLGRSGFTSLSVLLLVMMPTALTKPNAINGDSHLNVREELQGRDREVPKALGYVLGTRTIDGNPTELYKERRFKEQRYIGTFSLGVNRLKRSGVEQTPEAADLYWLRVLSNQVNEYERRCNDAGLDPSDSHLALNYFDLYSQDPVAASYWLASSDALKQKGLTSDSLTLTRSRSLGVLDDATDTEVSTEQRQRVQAIEDFIAYRRPSRK